jgi:hypothetical protein
MKYYGELDEEETKRRALIVIARISYPKLSEAEAVKSLLEDLLRERPLKELFTVTINNQEYRWPGCALPLDSGESCKEFCCGYKPLCHYWHLFEDVNNGKGISLFQIFSISEYNSLDFLNLTKAIVTGY